MISVRGQVGGTLTTYKDTIKAGKNVGRANETTAAEQAQAEAQSKWEKKLKKDYCKTAEAAMAGESSDLVKGGILPMLAHKYRDHAKKIIWPAFAQPKLDGHRCIAMVDAAGKCQLWSRSRKQIISVPHIVRAIEAMDLRSVDLDGELYNHDYHDNFEAITHLLKRDEPCQGGQCEQWKRSGVECPGHTAAQYHIYDLAVPDRTFADRTDIIAQWSEAHKWADAPGQPLVRVQTIQVHNDAQLMKAMEDFMEQGYEGAMVRNADSPYHNKKCYDLLKVKVYEDAEFVITDVKEGRGSMAGMAVFICTIPEDFEDERARPGATFDAKMKGKLKDLRQYWDDPSLVIGRVVTVQFQGFTRKECVPRFPVALRFREDL
jgi:ATP-dependent DNA ligase